MVVFCCCSPLPCSRLSLDQQPPLLLQLISLSGDLLLAPTWGEERGGEGRGGERGEGRGGEGRGRRGERRGGVG